jgi:serine/threonine protein phosphatase 1
MGNHEAMLLNAIKDEAELSKWIINGGAETLKSFNVKSPDKIDQVYIDFFNALSFYHAHDDFLFVHAGFNDDVNNPFDDKYFMIWECRKVYNNPALKNKTIIHGHRPVKATDCDERIRSNSSVINIDTGCVYNDRPGYGRLTALELNTKRVFFV